jgi:hypothetical protein
MTAPSLAMLHPTDPLTLEGSGNLTCSASSSPSPNSPARCRRSAAYMAVASGTGPRIPYMSYTCSSPPATSRPCGRSSGSSYQQ